MEQCRTNGIFGPRRPASQGTRVSDRARGDRSFCKPVSGGAGKCSCRKRKRPRQAIGRLYGAKGRNGNKRGATARVSAGAVAALHASFEVRDIGGPAENSQRESRPEGAAGAAAGGSEKQKAAERNRGDGRGNLGAGDATRSGGDGGELFRSGRALAFSHAGDVTHPAGVCRGVRAAQLFGEPHGGRAGSSGG